MAPPPPCFTSKSGFLPHRRGFRFGSRRCALRSAFLSQHLPPRWGWVRRRWATGAALGPQPSKKQWRGGTAGAMAVAQPPMREVGGGKQHARPPASVTTTTPAPTPTVVAATVTTVTTVTVTTTVTTPPAPVPHVMLGPTSQITDASHAQSRPGAMRTKRRALQQTRPRGARPQQSDSTLPAQTLPPHAQTRPGVIYTKRRALLQTRPSTDAKAQQPDSTLPAQIKSAPVSHLYRAPISERKKERRKNRHNFIGWVDHAGISYGGVEIVGTRRAVAHQLPWLSGN